MLATIGTPVQAFWSKRTAKRSNLAFIALHSDADGVVRSVSTVRSPAWHAALTRCSVARQVLRDPGQATPAASAYVQATHNAIGNAHWASYLLCDEHTLRLALGSEYIVQLQS